jgi:hypothetical protein
MRGTLSFVAALAAAAAACIAGCATDPSNQADDAADTGQLVLALTQPGPHGEIYHLNNATFEVVRIEDGATTFVDGSGFDGPAVVSLPPGVVNITLLAGWTLEKSVDGGLTFQPVSALLGSPNPNATRILANQPAFVEFAFLIRQTDGTLAISLGVDPSPRELAGGMIVSTATDGLSGYLTPSASTLDFAVYFKLFSLETVNLPDGSKQRVYTAFGQQGSLGPIPLASTAVAAEFSNDEVGALSALAAGIAGGSLTFSVSARTDGTFELSGQLFGAGSELDFGPHAIDAILPTIGPDGFPADVFFYDSTLPFTLNSSLGTMTGILRMRNLLPQP